MSWWPAGWRPRHDRAAVAAGCAVAVLGHQQPVRAPQHRPSAQQERIIGLLAAAQGRRRVDPIEDLVRLRIGARIDQPGRLERDFQTGHTHDGNAMPLSYRFYLADAVFAVAIEADPALLDGLREALRRPAFPLFLGRKSCPPAGKLDHGLREGDLVQVLSTEPWLASPWVRRQHRDGQVVLDMVCDCTPDTPGSEVVRDDPITFNPAHRRYGWRTVRREPVRVPNPDHDPSPRGDVDPHDPMALLGSLS